MIVWMRLEVPESDADEFRSGASTAVDYLAGCPGADRVELVRSLDSPTLWAIASRWRDVGSYRRALGGYAGRMALMPVMAWMIDEPSAFDDPDDVGTNLPRML